MPLSSSASSSMSQQQNQTPFGYLIGTNKHTVAGRDIVVNKTSCCRASKVKKRKMKLFCADGSTIMTDVSIVKKCTCSNECMANYDDKETNLDNNRQRMLRHSYHVQA